MRGRKMDRKMKDRKIREDECALADAGLRRSKAGTDGM
jgi:hypothetical protein